MNNNQGLIGINLSQATSGELMFSRSDSHVFSTQGNLSQPPLAAGPSFGTPGMGLGGASNLSNFGTGVGGVAQMGPGMGNMMGSQPGGNFGMPSQNLQGNPGMIGMQSGRSPEQILEAMAQIIRQQATTGLIKFLQQFFLPYDLHHRRTYEAWELQIIFLDAISSAEADTLIKANNAATGQPMTNNSIPYSALVAALAGKIPQLPQNNTVIQPDSIFLQKPKHPMIMQHLSKILQVVKQRGIPLQDAYSLFFQKNHFDRLDFNRFISQQCGIQTMGGESDMLWAFFQVAGETMIQKITFVQALKSVEAVMGGGSFGNSLTTPGFNQQLGSNTNFGHAASLQQPPLMQQPSLILQQQQPLLQPSLTQAPSMMMQPPLTQQLSITQQASFTSNQAPANISFANNSFGTMAAAPPLQTAQQVGIPQQVFDQIGRALEQNYIRDLRKHLPVQMLDGTRLVVPLEPFLAFLRTLLKLDQASAFQITQAFLIPVPQMQVGYGQFQGQPQYVVDLQAFEAKVYAGGSSNLMSQQSIQQQQNSYQVLQKLYEFVRRYILSQGGDIMHFFLQADINGDNYVSKQELAQVLIKMGITGISETDLHALFAAFDENQDGRISYCELCKQFAEFSSTKAIKDPRHWAWYIFEGIRRACSVNQISLAQLFGVNNFQFRGWNDTSMRLTRDQFLRALQQLQIPLSLDNQRRLFELLESSKVAMQNEVDFIHFSELVGIHYSSSQKYEQKRPQQLTAEQHRRFFRTLFTLLQDQGLSLQNLQQILRSAELQQNQGMNVRGMLSVQDFLARVQSLSATQSVDLQTLRDIAQRFALPENPALINYDEFLKSAGFEFEKFKLLDMIFVTLQAALEQLRATTLAELFQKVAPALNQQFNVQSIDKDLLQSVLKASGGLMLKPYEVEMVLLEYAPGGSGMPMGRLDFEAFDREFRAFQQGQSALNSYNKRNTGSLDTDFRKYLQTQPQIPTMMARQGSLTSAATSKKQMSPYVKEGIRKAATLIEQDQSLRITDLVQRYQANTASGMMPTRQFESMLMMHLRLKVDEAGHLISHYDPLGRQEVSIAEFLDDVKDEVVEVSRRMELINAATSFGQSSTMQSQSSNNLGDPLQILIQTYQKDFEEIYKSFVVRGNDPIQWFQSYSQQPGRQGLTRRELAAALQSLNLSRQLSEADLTQFFVALDSMNSGVIQIGQLDQLLKRAVGNASVPQMQDDIVERIARVFQGDTNFLQRELMKQDAQGFGMVSIQAFVSVIRTQSPGNVQFSTTDLMFLAKKYQQQQQGNAMMSINVFIDDLRRAMMRKGISAGTYSQHLAAAQEMQRLQPTEYGTGHINPLLGTGVRNTRTEQLGPVRDIDRQNFKTTISESYFEDIVKGTYIKGQTVYEYFVNYAQTKTQKGEMLQSSDFSKAIQALQIGWTLNSTENFFTQVDLVQNQGMRQSALSAMQLDEAVCLGCKKSITEMQDEVLKLIVQHALQKDLDMRGELKKQDIAGQSLVSVDSLCDVVLNKMKVPMLAKTDVVFLSKKYIKTLPNQVQYEQLLDDFKAISKVSFFNIANYKSICSYIRKSCLALHGITEIQEFFKGQIQIYKKEQLLTLQEFIKGCAALALIPEICQESHLQSLYREMDTANTAKISLEQLSAYIRKISTKSTKELQDEVIEEICIKLRSTNTMNIDNMFKQDDPTDRGLIPVTNFNIVLQRMFQVKEIDAKVLGLRYTERSKTAQEVNYKKFALDVQQKIQSMTIESKAGQAESMLSVGLNGKGLDMTANNQRLKQVLAKVNEHINRTKVSFVNLLSPFENAYGHVPYDQFIFVLQNQVLPIHDEDYRFLAENYLQQGMVAPGQARAVDYRKFLSDIKLHGGEPAKTIQGLTVAQQQIYNQIAKYLKSKGSGLQFAQAIIERDPTVKGYLRAEDLEQIVAKFFQNQINRTQFQNLIGALDQNAALEYNYKQLLELSLGAEDAQKFFAGAALGGNKMMAGTQGPKFVMPLQPQGAKSAIMADIGKKIIAAGKNYEEEIKLRIGEQQATAQVPKITESEFEQVLASLGLRLTQDERLTLQAYITSVKDPNSFVPVMEFLQSLGLPPQNLGFRGQKQLPRKILSERERKYAQELIFKIRAYFNQMKIQPKDVFEKCRPDPRALSMNEFQLRMLAQNGDLGAIGRQMNDDQFRLLVYYLTQEVPGEISFKKLYLAFTQLEKDPPLTQEGAEDIRRYENIVKEQARKGTPLEVVELVHFMRSTGQTMASIFKSAQRGIISRQDFENALTNAGFKAKDPLKLIEVLDTKGDRRSVSLDKLQEYLSRAPTESRGITPQIARDRYQSFDPKVRQLLQRISEFLKRNNITLPKLYEMMDRNKDGRIDRDEFVTLMPQVMQVPGIDMRDYAMIYNALDVNNDSGLTLQEFGMFVEGAKVDKLQRMQDIDPKLVQDMTREIQMLFQQFDINKDGWVEAEEIMRSMMALGHRITLEDAQQMVRQVDQNGDGKLEVLEFTELMLRQMKEELLSREDDVEDLKAKFMDADVDHSGTLSVDEIHGVLLRLGAELSMDELVELMHEIDVDRSGTLDIDEFVALMTTTGDEIQFANPQAKTTLMNIKKARKLNPLDFFKCFKSMPSSFVPSFIAERWSKKKNLPSSVFMPQVEPRTMLYKDLLPCGQENIPPAALGQRALHPRLLPVSSELGCQLLFEEATGVPLPMANEQFDRSQIVKRAVRVALYDTVKKEIIANAVQVNALYQGETAEDIWQFPSLRDNGLNPVVFRSANKDDVIKPHVFMVFELVIYVRFGAGTPSEKVVEMSCGWCQIDMNNAMETFARQMTHKLAIKGGSPSAEMLIKDADIHTNRSGIKHQLMKVVTAGKIQPQLTVQIRPMAKFTEETKFHLEMLPSLCFVQKRLLYFVSGFRNYLGEKLLKGEGQGVTMFKKPEGDALITTFPKVLDCPDICELLVAIWSEDVWSTLTAKQKLNIENLILKTKDFLRKLYPVVYADDFQYRESASTASAAGDQHLSRKREELVKSALRFGNPQAKMKADRPIEALTSFRPFTVRELDFEVWDNSQAKNDRFLSQYEELGLINSNKGASSGLQIQQPFGQQSMGLNSQMLGTLPGPGSLQGGLPGANNFGAMGGMMPNQQQQQQMSLPSFDLADQFTRKF